MMKRFALLSVLVVNFVLSGILNTATAQNPRPKPCGSCFVFDNISCRDIYDVTTTPDEPYCPPNECFFEGSCQLASDTKYRSVENADVVRARKRHAREGETGRSMSPESPVYCFQRRSCDGCRRNPFTRRLECHVVSDILEMAQGSYCDVTETCTGEGVSGPSGPGGGVN